MVRNPRSMENHKKGFYVFTVNLLDRNTDRDFNSALITKMGQSNDFEEYMCHLRTAL